VRWFADGYVLKERVNSCQSRVPRANGTAALVFEMIEERSHKSLVKLVHIEIGWASTESLCCETQQQAEGVSIAGYGVWACTQLANKAIRKKTLEQGWEAGHHDVTP
jgi:hypothetical protein